MFAVIQFGNGGYYVRNAEAPDDPERCLTNELQRATMFKVEARPSHDGKKTVLATDPPLPELGYGWNQAHLRSINLVLT